MGTEFQEGEGEEGGREAALFLFTPVRERGREEGKAAEKGKEGGRRRRPVLFRLGVREGGDVLC